MSASKRVQRVGCIDGSIVAVSATGSGVRLSASGAGPELAVELSGPAAATLIGHLAAALADWAESGPAPEAETVAAPPAQAPPPSHVPEPADRHESEKVADLIEAGLLVSGASLVMAYRGDYHFAVVSEDGTFQVGEAAFGSPSGAAGHVTGGSTDGWLKWRVAEGTDEGLALADLRWRLRARRFPPRGDRYAASTRNEKRQLAVRWVDHALSNGLDPARRDDAAVEDLLSGHDYAETTLASYRRHLHQWFQLHMPDS